MAQKPRSIDSPAQASQVVLRSSTYDRKSGTVEAILSTGERVLRNDGRLARGPYWEELGLSTDQIRLGRLNSGRCNVLDNHGASNGVDWGERRGQLENILGVVVGGSARVETIDGKPALVATLRLSNREDLEGMRQDVADGIVSQISGAYYPWGYALVETAADGYPVFRCIDWEPYEVSFVALPAEAGARLRSDPQTLRPCSVVDRRAGPNSQSTDPMEPNETASTDPAQTTQGSNAPVATAPVTRSAPAQVPAPVAAVAPASAPASNGAAPEDAALAERRRGIEINALVRNHALPDTTARRLIESGASLDVAREQILAELQTRGQGQPASAVPGASTAGLLTVSDRPRDPAISRENDAIAIALQHRALPTLIPFDKVPELARRFLGFSLLDIVSHVIERGGERTRGVSKDLLVRRGLHATSDFPEILANTAGRSLRDQYNTMPNTWTGWCRRATARDFKQISRTSLGGAPALVETAETAAIQRGTMAEAAEKYALKTYGRILPISRQAIINDDLEAFTRIPAQFAVSASTLIEDLVYAILTANAAMADTVALFHATHGNLSTGAGSALTAANEAGLAAARVLMRNQTGLDGKYLNFAPSILLVPVALETTAERLVATLQPVVSSGVNPFAGKLRVIANPRLDVSSTAHWFAIVDPSLCDTVEVSFLEGSDGPRIETRQGFDVEGVEIKCALDVGAKAIDWRGMVQSNGS